MCMIVKEIFASIVNEKLGEKYKTKDIKDVKVSNSYCWCNHQNKKKFLNVNSEISVD